jgi:hypothetical protein
MKEIFVLKPNTEILREVTKEAKSRLSKKEKMIESTIGAFFPCAFQKRLWEIVMRGWASDLVAGCAQDHF